MPRILHVISGLATGGAEMALYRLVTSSQGDNCTHVVIALTPEGAMGQRLRDAGIELTALNFKASPVLHFIHLFALMRRTCPDVVQTWMYHADMFGGLAARLAGIRNVIWGIRTTDLTAGDARATVVVRKLCAWLSHWVPHTIVCVAEAARNTHMSVGYDAARMVVVPNGFELAQMVAADEQTSALRAQCGFDQGDVVIGTLGRFNASKDQQNFVRAAALLARQHEKLRFLMVGRGVDSGNAELVHWIAQTGYAERFVLLGERLDVPVCLSAMDIFCLPSRAEGFPNVVGEAMAMAVPCVVTDVGDAAVLVGDAGVVVPKENSEALAHGLNRLLTMPAASRRQLGLQARARIHAEFAMERVRERFEAIYQCMTKEGKY